MTISGENTEITATGTPVDVTLNNNGSVTTGYALAITHNGTDEAQGRRCRYHYGGKRQVLRRCRHSGTFCGQDDRSRQWLSKTASFTSAPDAAYLAEGKTLVKSTETGYNWMVADKQADAAEVLPADPEAKIELPEGREQ